MSITVRAPTTGTKVTLTAMVMATPVTTASIPPTPLKRIQTVTGRETPVNAMELTVMTIQPAPLIVVTARMAAAPTRRSIWTATASETAAIRVRVGQAAVGLQDLVALTGLME